ncbi:S-layer family protein [Kamptonema sp. UHCC 0994]|uniref:S-layer family protein n=1 Tax=Kamptonema sp. UHCC 0994 TaxID=3031329 RepID=UPI0023BA0480|nr:S-layer family protein [Kamptonema sp. UHCC 0994]MDF0554482.1 S-layer family protein [Kamptonema sp. UHCC 0994]
MVYHPIRFASTLLFLLIPAAVNAQVTPDRTLPNNSTVIQDGNTNRIEGGTRLNSNLFHSFQEFSVPNGGTAFFNNATDIQNIISRVTGGNISNINGLIRANGTANLFLLNPAGIIFGPNAQLNIGGSFVASTANSIQFADGKSFNANPQSAPVLTVSVPIGVQFGRNPTKNSGAIAIQSQATDSDGNLVGLQVNPGQTLGLIGREIRLAGGNLTAPGGTIELATGNWQFGNSTPNNSPLGDILLSQQATVNTSGLGGGTVRVQGKNVVISDRASILANTLGNLNGGGIDIQAQNLSIQSGGLISSSTFGTGAGGNVNINASQSVTLAGSTPFLSTIKLLSGTFGLTDLTDGIFTVSASPGNAGSVTINAPQTTITNGATILTSALGPGLGGNMTIASSEKIEISNGSIALTGTSNTGNAGDMNLNAPLLISQNGGVFATNPSITSEGKGGNLNVNADTVELGQVPAGAPAPGGLFTVTLGAGDGGDLTIKTRQLTVKNGSQVSASSAGKGKGGNLTINASNVELSGLSADGRFLSGLFTSSSLLTVTGQRGIAAAGNLTVTTNRLSVRNGAQISAATGSEGQAGNLNLTAKDAIEVSGFATNVDPSVEAVSFGIIGDGIVPTAIESNTSGAGQAGDLIIKTGQLTVSNGAEIGVRGTGTGRAGNLEIDANNVRLNNQGTISAATASGGGGNILVRSNSLQLRRNSNISTNAGSADGGNITLDTGGLAALENSDITANAIAGTGGRVAINTQGVFGTAFRQAQTSESDITATSDLGAQFSGVVVINTPDINPSSGLVELPTDVLDAANLTVQGCGGDRGNSFVVTGRGGLPASPFDALSSDAVVVNWIGPVEENTDSRGGAPVPAPNQGSRGNFPVNRQQLTVNSQQSTVNRQQLTVNSQESQLIEAQGWVIGDRGEVELVAAAPNAEPHSAGIVPPACRSR